MEASVWIFHKHVIIETNFTPGLEISNRVKSHKFNGRQFFPPWVNFYSILFPPCSHLWLKNDWIQGFFFTGVQKDEKGL